MTCNKCNGLNNAGYPIVNIGDIIAHNGMWLKVEVVSDTSCFVRRVEVVKVRGQMRILAEHAGEATLLYFKDIDWTWRKKAKK